MKRSTDRILTTHAGSLARPHELLDLLQARVSGKPYQERELAERVRQAVAEVVRRQAETGIDVVSDGEQSKAGFYGYISERLSGLEPTEASGIDERAAWREELEEFPEYYREYLGGKNRATVRNPPLVCTGPVTYRGQAAVQADIQNLQAALAQVQVAEAFMPVVAPRELGRNQYYASGEEFLFAVAEAMREEYRAIVDAGLLLQIDDPWLTGFYRDDPDPLSPERHVEALNHALRGIPPERVRYHTCYGINEGPRVHDVPLEKLTALLFRINAEAYSFEAANARHQHEWHVWEEVKLPEGKIIIPGLITHASNIVEHPRLIADLLLTYARLVGRENVIAGADCGFSSQATYTPEVHPKVVWAKFEALAEGARLASQALWG